jgi:hypothetical protein
MRRRSEFVDTVEGLGPQDHVCWPFANLEQFRAQAIRFISDGLFAGQRVYYMARGDTGQMIDDLAPVVGLDAALASGRARVTSVDAIYSTGTVVDPVEQVAIYADATEAALADGYTGLRVAVDATDLVRTPEQLDAFARYEHLADRYMTRRPFSAMCGYDSREISATSMAELACMHPVTTWGAAPFRLHPAAEAELSAVLSGELDHTTRALFAGALRRADFPLACDGVVVDGRALDFADHRSLVDFANHLSERGTPGVLRAVANGPVHTLIRLLSLPGLRVSTV